MNCDDCQRDIDERNVRIDELERHEGLLTEFVVAWRDYEDVDEATSADALRDIARRFQAAVDALDAAGFPWDEEEGQ